MVQYFQTPIVLHSLIFNIRGEAFCSCEAGEILAIKDFGFHCPPRPLTLPTEALNKVVLSPFSTKKIESVS